MQSKPMTEQTINHLFTRLKAAGEVPLDFKPHGLRSTASTILNNNKLLIGIDGDVIEAVLAHVDVSSVRGGYNHAVYSSPVQYALQWYADHIDKLVAGADVIKLKIA
jgi:integrase